MIETGRTTRAACEAGTLYQVEHPTYARFGAQFPWAETPAEAAGGLAWPHATYSNWYPDGTVFAVRRVLDSTIGCTHVSAPVAHFRFRQGHMVEEVA